MVWLACDRSARVLAVSNAHVQQQHSCLHDCVHGWPIRHGFSPQSVATSLVSSGSKHTTHCRRAKLCDAALNVPLPARRRFLADSTLPLGGSCPVGNEAVVLASLLSVPTCDPVGGMALGPQGREESHAQAAQGSAGYTCAPYIDPAQAAQGSAGYTVECV